MIRGKLHLPMYESLKSTLSLTLSIVGTTSCCRQSRASGHFDIICASSATLFTCMTSSVPRISDSMPSHVKADRNSRIIAENSKTAGIKC